ncbi:unnamed protein product [Schistocephalus solidus]|uniref:Uncharacterized protein n=1 Tax=Schistocephalus solidus TaxID=70667 RepID=A0A3P7F1J1_SCHSO|nr:unnamed protein product [Schistocephalus solidus]
MVAYENPIDSPFGDLAHFRHRKVLADSVNNTILAHLGKSGFPLLETGISILEQTVMGAKSTSKCSNKLSDACQTLQPSFSSSETLTPLQSTTSSASAALRTSTTQHPTRHSATRRSQHHTGTSTTLVITSTSTARPQNTGDGDSSTSGGTRNLRPVYPLPFFASSAISTGSASEVFAVPISHISPSTTTEGASSGGGTSTSGRFRSTIVQSSIFPAVSPPPSSEGDEFARLFNAYMQGPQVYIQRLQRNHRHAVETVSRDSGARSDSSPSGGQKYTSSTSAAAAAAAAAADALTAAEVLIPGSEFAGFFHPTLFL